MAFDPAKLSTIVKDYHYGFRESSDIPKVYILELTEAKNCFRVDSVSSFKSGLHLVIEITHRLGNVSMKNIDEAYTLFHQIRSCIHFFSSILNKLELNEDTMYVRAVLSCVIGFEEKMQKRLEDHLKKEFSI